MVKSAGISIHVGMINSPHKIHLNQRHLGIDFLPERYRDIPRYSVIRKPEDWYRSFYRFFINVHGYMSFMLNDPKDDGYIYPIDFNEFVKRSTNLKDTLIKFPNKARVFNNILRSQGNAHFVTTYFKEAIDISPDNVFGNIKTLDQFDMSLYEWFYKGAGLDTSINIPIERLDIIEDIFDIKIGHENKTNSKLEIEYTPDVLQELRKTHKKFYDEYNSFNEKDIK